MRILVLGGSYFVGRHIALEFARKGADVVVLNRGTRPVNFPVLVADRNDVRGMREALRGQSFDVVVDTSCQDTGQAFAAMQALGGRYRRYVFISTPAVYDDGAPRPLVESAPAGGSKAWGDFGANKAKAELLLREMCSQKLTIVRPAYVYGPFNNLARETFIWSRVLRDKPVFVPGSGTTQVSFIHAHDLAAIVRVLALDDRARGATYNVAHPEPVTFERWVREVARAAGAEARVVHVPAGTLHLSARDYFPFRDQELTLDVEALANICELPKVDLAAGLAQTFEFHSRDALELVARESSVDLELSLALGVH